MTNTIEKLTLRDLLEKRNDFEGCEKVQREDECFYDDEVVHVVRDGIVYWFSTIPAVSDKTIDYLERKYSKIVDKEISKLTK